MSPSDAWRRRLRDWIVAVLTAQPTGMKLWEFQHIGRYILWVLFRVEKHDMVVAPAGPVGQRFRMMLRWRVDTAYVVGIYEPEVISALRKYLQVGDACIDVGGHLGYLSLFMALTVGPTGQVVTFEPVPETNQVLEENIRLNGCTNMRLERAAVGEMQGTCSVQMSAADKLSWSSTMSEYAAEDQQKSIDVPLVTIDGYLQRTGMRPKLIKVDVEGAELAVLRGAHWTMQEIRPMFLTEIHGAGIERDALVQSLFVQFDYVTTVLGHRNHESFCLAIPRSKPPQLR